ncbi:MAG: SMC-Scp complex subunit ScpB [Chlorobi bacterium]|nr:SMC-Scp complex subunit ScpB [Chlorobiota bacterium]
MNLTDKNSPEFLTLARLEQKTAVEALIFASDEPATFDFLYTTLIEELKPKAEIKVHNVELFSGTLDGPELIQVLSDSVAGQEAEPEDEPIDESRSPEVIEILLNELIDGINADLRITNRPYHIIQIAGGWQFATRPEYGELIMRLSKSKSKRRFSQAALETMAIIAYRQPITKPEIEQIRGVNSNEIVNSLIDKKLVEMVGRKDVLGKPLLFSTTSDFLRIFGLNDLDDLPKLRELEELDTEDIMPDSHLEFTIDASSAEAFKSLPGIGNKSFLVETDEGSENAENPAEEESDSM